MIVVAIYTTGEVDHTNETIAVDYYFDFYNHINNKDNFYKAFSYAIAKIGAVYFRHQEKDYYTF